MLSTQSELADASLTRPRPADRLERWPIERLIPYANNARLHSEADIDKLADSLDYVPLPDSVTSQIKSSWKSQIKDASGKPVY